MIEDYKSILPNETVQLNNWLLENHTHAELCEPEEKVYKESDVFELIDKLRKSEI